MNKRLSRLAGLIVALAMILGNTVNTKALASTYYVSPTGSDSNPGTASAPFRTFAKANSLLIAGNTLYIYAGLYSEPLRISKSGTSSAWITVKPVSGNVVIDVRNLTNPAANISGSYVAVSNLEIRGSNEVCVRLAGKYVKASGLIVHECRTHGILASNQNIEITGNTVYRASLSNQLRNLASGWGSGIKVGLGGDNILINNNKVYNNYGEGIAATRASNVTIRGNNVYDNFSVNLYVDNSLSILVEKNFVTCHPNSGFERNGNPAAGISLAEEFYTGWGARLDRVTIKNNIVSFCKHGIRYNGADDSLTGGGLKNSTIAYNTLYGSTNSAIGVVYESAQGGSLIADNIVWQAQNVLTYIDSPTGLTFKNNQWKVLPPSAVRGQGDRIGDPKFALAPGYTPESYRPGSTSPALAGAVDVGIPHDYFTRPRGPAFDMGAIQITSGTLASGASLSLAITRPTNTPLLPTPTRVLPTPTATSLPPTATLPPPTATFTSTPIQPSSTATEPPQEVTYDNKDSAFVYSENWTDVVTAAAIGGSFAQTTIAGSFVTFPFTGQSFSLIYHGGPAYQKLDVFVDDVLVGTLDQRLDVDTYPVRWDSPSQLPPGQHTLKLVFVAAEAGATGSLDAVIVR